MLAPPRHREKGKTDQNSAEAVEKAPVPGLASCLPPNTHWLLEAWRDIRGGNDESSEARAARRSRTARRPAERGQAGAGGSQGRADRRAVGGRPLGRRGGQL